MGETWRADGRMMRRRERGEGILKDFSAFYETKENGRNHGKEGNKSSRRVLWNVIVPAERSTSHN